MPLDAIAGDPRTHTMGNSLLPYVRMKAHHLLDHRDVASVRVVGSYDRRSTIVSEREKTDKRFNWKRPTAVQQGDTVVLHCFPGDGYAFHYGCLAATYLRLCGRGARVTWTAPGPEACAEAVARTSLPGAPRVHTAIMGYVHRLGGLVADPTWRGDGDFLWRVGSVGGRPTMLLGCQFSYWADIAGAVVTQLAGLGVERVVYVGKLGVLDAGVVPNTMLGTGSSSLVEGVEEKWENPFDESEHELLFRGRHVTVPSVIQEDRAWLGTVVGQYAFVDPEVGYMARAARQAGVQFGFLHVCSDNLVVEHDEDLSNEREGDVRHKRASLFSAAAEILRQAL